MSKAKMLHTMIRVGDLDRSIQFYTEILGMTLQRRNDNTDYQYTIAFLNFGENSGSDLELTYNWGTDNYELGTGFGHLAIGIDDIYKTCEEIKAAGGNVTREAGPVKGGTTIIAFVKDPDGYMIELIQNNQSKTEL